MTAPATNPAYAAGRKYQKTSNCPVIFRLLIMLWFFRHAPKTSTVHRGIAGIYVRFITIRPIDYT
ncbi:hypothetical protein [Thalassospira marina]|uniref:hypothetical protein n=1 Tax=Thalassospira marina TaxID=2048283 RepID=UPI000C6ECCCA|nr:hypothetical protein [Thalassospira marina]